MQSATLYSYRLGGYELGYSTIGSNQLRLLQLLPGTTGDKIHCQLEVYDRDTVPPYYALSYCWGTEPPSCQILLNNNIFFIRLNLFQFLIEFRSKHTPLALWVDAVCINQDDVHERSEQVKYMRDIYEGAGKVIVWLGEAKDDSNFAMDFVSMLETLRPGCSDDISNLQPSFVRGSTAVWRLIGREWFSRIWVVQKVALARSALIICGSRELRFSTLIKAISIAKDLATGACAPTSNSTATKAVQAALRRFEHSSATQLLRIIIEARKRKARGSSGARFPLDELICTLTAFEATDARDIIYGVLGLSYPIGIRPDYTKTTIEVYADFIWHYIAKEQRIDIILRRWAERWGSSEQLSSWMGSVEYSELDAAKTRGVLEHGSARRFWGAEYRASGDLSPSVLFDLDAKHGPTLFVDILLFPSSARWNCMSPKIINGHVARSFLEPPEGSLPISPSKHASCLWETMCAGCDDNGNPADMTLYHRLTTQIIAHSLEMIPDLSDPYLSTKEDEKVALNRIKRVTSGKSLWRFSQQRAPVALVPSTTREFYDRLCILRGCSIPVILRTLKKNVRYKIVGPAYIPGYMNGEALAEIGLLRRFRWKRIALI